MASPEILSHETEPEEQRAPSAVPVSIARMLLFLVVLTPIILVPGFFFPFVTLRNVFFRVCVEVAFGLLLYKYWDRLGSLASAADPILKWFFALIAAMGISALFGVAPWRSVFGDFERMAGVWAWMHLALLYLVLRVSFTERLWVRLFRTVLFVGDFVALWGSTDLLPVAHRNPLFTMRIDVGSTIGNAGLCAAFLLFVIGFAAWLLLSDRSKGWRAFYLLSLVISIYGLAGTLNRSAAIGAAVGAIAGFGIYLHLTRGRRAATLYAIVLLLLLFGGVIFARSLAATKQTQSSFGRAKWSSVLELRETEGRTIQWKAAARAFLHRPVLGYGPENHQVIASQYFDQNIYRVAGGGIFDRPHNAWLELLSSVGITGTIAMIGLWMSFLFVVRRGWRQQTLGAAEAALWIGLSIAFAVHLTFWFFDVNSSIFWVMMLAAVTSKVYGPLTPPDTPLSGYAPRRLFLVAAELMVVLAVFLHGVIPLKAAHDLDTAIGNESSLQDRLSAYYRVMSSSAPQTFHTTDLYARFLARLTPLYPQSRRDPLTYALIDLALKHGFLEAKRNISRNPYEERVYMDQAKISLLADVFYVNRAYLGGAMKTLRHAVKLAPLRPEPRVLLGNVYLTAGDTVAALAQFDSARTVAPLYGSTYIQFAKVAASRHQIPEAIGYLSTAMKGGATEAGALYWRIGKDLEAQGRFKDAASVTRAYLEAKDTPLAGWKGGCPVRGGLIAFDRAIANHLPIVLLKSGQPDEAIVAARAFSGCVTRASTTVESFTADVKAGRGAQWVTRNFLYIGA